MIKMQNKKTFGIIVFFTVVILSAYLIYASSVLGFLFYDSTQSSSLTINNGESFGITVSADSIFENYMNVKVELLSSQGDVVATLLNKNVVQDSYSNNILVGKSEYGSAGDYTLKLTVTGDSGQISEDTLSLTVKALSPTNHLPVINSQPVTEINEEASYSYQVAAVDTDGDTLSYTLTQKPSWISINSQTGLISGTSPSVTQDENFVVTLYVSDGKDSVQQTYNLLVKNVVVPPANHAPVISSSPVTSVNESSIYNYQVNASDEDGDVLSYSVNGPSWISVNSATGLVTGTSPSVDADTDYSVILTVSDGDKSVNQEFTITVKNVVVPPANHAPVINTIPNQSVNENSAYNYQVIASDADGDSLTYSVTGANWVSISNYGLISGTAPSVNSNTNYDVTVSVSDGKATTEKSYSIQVLDIVVPPTNHAPVITSSPVTSVNESSSYVYDVQASDADGDTLVYSLSGPSWLSINSASGLISGTAPSVDADTGYGVSIVVSDGEYTDTQSYTLLVLDTDVPPTNDTTAPTITITSPTSTTYTSDSANVIVSTDEAATAWFSLDGASNVTLNTVDNWNFNYVIASLSEGSHTLTVYAQDSSGNIGSASVTFSVDTSSSGGNPIGGKSSKKASGGFKTLVFDNNVQNGGNLPVIAAEDEPSTNEKTRGDSWKILVWILGILIFLLLLLILIGLLQRD